MSVLDDYFDMREANGKIEGIARGVAKAMISSKVEKLLKDVEDEIVGAIEAAIIDGIHEGEMGGRIMECIDVYKELNYPDDEIKEQIMERFGLSDDQAVEYMKGS